jgi:hypothetical protein
MERSRANLDETDILGVFSEALSANVEAVLADQTSLMSTHTAIHVISIIYSSQYRSSNHKSFHHDSWQIAIRPVSICDNGEPTDPRNK